MDFVKSVDEIQLAITQNLCQQYRLKETLCPDTLVGNLFTTAAIDNIDHNEKSSTSSSHFHGTSISVFQHYEKENITYNFSKAEYEKEKKNEVPLYYNHIIPVNGVKILFLILTSNEYPKNITVNSVHDSLEWLKLVDDTNSKNTKSSGKSCNWAAYYQQNIVKELQIPCSSVLLPLINESINSPAMVKDCMTFIQKLVHKVNPG